MPSMLTSEGCFVTTRNSAYEANCLILFECWWRMPASSCAKTRSWSRCGQTPLSKTTIWTIAFRSYENCSTRRNTSKGCHDTVIDSLLQLETSCQHPHKLCQREASPSLHCLAR